MTHATVLPLARPQTKTGQLSNSARTRYLKTAGSSGFMKPYYSWLPSLLWTASYSSAQSTVRLTHSRLRESVCRWLSSISV
jgi:hypothetical protein